MSDHESRPETHLLEDEDMSVSDRVPQFSSDKLWSCEDSQLKGQIEEKENLIHKLGQQKIQILEKLFEITAETEGEISRLKSLNYDYWRLGYSERVDKMRVLQFILDKLNFVNNAYQGRPTKSNIRFSGDEFDKHKFQFRMLRGTKNLAEEKRMLREIKPSRRDDGSYHVNLEKLEKELSRKRQRSPHCYDSNCKYCIGLAKEEKLTLEIYRARASAKGKIFLGSKLDLQNELRYTSSELDKQRKIHFETRYKKKRVAKLEKDIEFLKQKLHVINTAKDKAQRRILVLRSKDTNA